MSNPSTPAAAAAEVQRQNQTVAETRRQNSLRKMQQQNQSVAPIIQQKQKEKETRKQVQRDRATVQAAAKAVNSPLTSDADKSTAIATISRTVLKTTGLVADDAASSQMLGRLAADLAANPGTVVALGVKDTIALKVSAADAATLTPKILDRLKKLV
jgi:hypothetical protein